MRANTGNPAREALWGSSGTALAALLLNERDGDQRYDDVLRAVQEELWAAWEPARKDGGLLWEKARDNKSIGVRFSYAGLLHGKSLVWTYDDGSTGSEIYDSHLKNIFGLARALPTVRTMRV